MPFELSPSVRARDHLTVFVHIESGSSRLWDGADGIALATAARRLSTHRGGQGIAEGLSETNSKNQHYWKFGQIGQQLTDHQHTQDKSLDRRCKLMARARQLEFPKVSVSSAMLNDQVDAEGPLPQRFGMVADQ